MFTVGKFGHKDLSRADESKFITSQKIGGVNNDFALKHTILSANDIVCKHCRFADKVPIVYPVEWVFFGGKYAIRAIAGKRNKVKLFALVKGAEKRKEKKRLRLFE